MSRRGAPRLAALVGALALALAVAACGGDPKSGGVASLSGSGGHTTTTTNAGTGQDPKKAALEFSKCMREHGINMPDPKFDSNGGITLGVKPGSGVPRPDDPKFKAAQAACQKYLPNGGQPIGKPNPQQQQQALKFARCMRQHGIDMPDPNPNGGGLMVGGGSGGRTTKAAPDDPKFKAAQQACQKYLPKGGMVTNGSGGGG